MEGEVGGGGLIIEKGALNQLSCSKKELWFIGGIFFQINCSMATDLLDSCLNFLAIQMY